MKGYYQRFLLPYERHLRTTGAWGSRPQGSAAAAAAAGGAPPAQLRQGGQQQGGGDAEMEEAPPLDAATLESALAIAMGSPPAQ